MSTKSIVRSISVLSLFSVLLIFGSEADARTYVPIFADDVVASIDVDGDVWVAPVSLGAELAAYHGQPVTVVPMSQVLAQLAPAALGGSLRFEGCTAAGTVPGTLAGKGYDTESSVEAVLLSADGASVWSD
jgi:hypothetical protein